MRDRQLNVVVEPTMLLQLLRMLFDFVPESEKRIKSNRKIRKKRRENTSNLSDKRCVISSFRCRSSNAFCFTLYCNESRSSSRCFDSALRSCCCFVTIARLCSICSSSERIRSTCTFKSAIDFEYLFCDLTSTIVKVSL